MRRWFRIGRAARNNDPANLHCVAISKIAIGCMISDQVWDIQFVNDANNFVINLIQLVGQLFSALLVCLVSGSFCHAFTDKFCAVSHAADIHPYMCIITTVLMLVICVVVCLAIWYRIQLWSYF